MKPFRARLEAALHKLVSDRLKTAKLEKAADWAVIENLSDGAVGHVLAIFDRCEARTAEQNTSFAKTEAERRALERARGLPERGYTDAEVADWAEVFLDLYLARVGAGLAS